MTAKPKLQYIRWFEDISSDDVSIVGGKNASLGEMYRELAPKGVRIPNGFAVTADGYRLFMQKAGLDQRIVEILADLDTSDIGNLRQRGHRFPF